MKYGRWATKICSIYIDTFNLEYVSSHVEVIWCTFLKMGPQLSKTVYFRVKLMKIWASEVYIYRTHMGIFGGGTEWGDMYYAHWYF